MLSVLRANAPKLKQCAGEAKGVVTVSVHIKGDGRVGSARVATGKFRGTETGKCIEAQVRAYRFKPFSGDPMRVNLPLKI